MYYIQVRAKKTWRNYESDSYRELKQYTWHHTYNLLNLYYNKFKLRDETNQEIQDKRNRKLP